MSTPEPPSKPSIDHGRRRQATMWEVVTAVLWSFFGVRKRTAMTDDAVSIRPYQFVLVGIMAAALMVLVLITLVRLIIHYAT